MTLYESNFVRLGWLVRDLRSITESTVSKTPTDCDLYLTPIELSRYTSVFRLTYEFPSEGRPDPGTGSRSGSVRVSRRQTCRSSQLSRLSTPSAVIQATVGTQA
jgi:uncharacterized protein YqiB (DUF1249 family)